MASFENAILGEVKGKIGEVIGRRRGNKYFIYAAPREVKISNSAEAIKSRSKLKTVAQFASIVNSIPELKYLWAKLKSDVSDAFHKIEKVNYPLFTYDRPTINNTIIPDNNNDNEIKESSISQGGVKLKIFIPNDEEANQDRAKELTGIGVISYYIPKSKDDDYFHLSKIRTGPIDVKIDEEFDLEIPFSGGERANYNSYMKSIIYFTMVSKDDTGTPVKLFGIYRCEFTNEGTGEKERFSIRDSQP
jgi:hypothetical protein